MTVVLFSRATGQVPVPIQPPPVQPAKIEPDAAVAESVTTVPGENDDEHVIPQLIPSGKLVTMPLPVPASAIVSEAALPMLL